METEFKKSTLTAADACEIIRVCSQNGVRRLSFEGLRVSFAAGQPKWPTPEAPSPDQTPEAVATAEKIDEQTREADDARAREAQMAELAVVDPVQYEELLEQGELVDAERTAEDSERTS